MKIGAAMRQVPAAVAEAAIKPTTTAAEEMAKEAAETTFGNTPPAQKTNQNQAQAPQRDPQKQQQEQLQRQRYIDYLRTFQNSESHEQQLKMKKDQDKKQEEMKQLEIKKIEVMKTNKRKQETAQVEQAKRKTERGGKKF